MNTSDYRVTFTLKMLLLLATIMLACSCSDDLLDPEGSGNVTSEIEEPLFELELFTYICFNQPHGEFINLCLCASEANADYLKKNYTLELENLVGYPLELIKKDEQGVIYACPSLSSDESPLSSVCEWFEEFRVTRDYSHYSMCHVRPTRAGMTVFRLKFTFEETSEVYYSDVYSLRAAQCTGEEVSSDTYDFWLYKGSVFPESVFNQY